MKLFEVKKISYYAPSRGYSIDLVEINGKLQFSILINSNDIQSIALAFEGIKVPRPTTHDIIIDILNYTDVKLDRVEIFKIHKGIFYSRLHIKNIYKEEKQINCKSSDAIAIAIRYCSPIYVRNHVLNNIKSKEVISDTTFHSIEKYKNQESSAEIVVRLNSALDEAINKENYEVAAKLRDKINSLEDTTN